MNTHILTANAAIPPIEVLCAELKWIELQVPCAREAVERVERFIDQVDSDLDVDARESVTLAFRELLMNAVEWGGKLDVTQRVRVIRMRARGVLVYRITDPGPGFRFDDLPHAAVAHEAENAIAHMEVRDKAGDRPSISRRRSVRRACSTLQSPIGARAWGSFA
jgi:anti-sigma regulatory factor (Ser/Thr protein kinase)